VAKIQFFLYLCKKTKKSDFMLKQFLTLLFLLTISVANAQTDTCTQHSLLKRKKFRLAFDTPNSSVLKKEELKLVLSNDQFSGYNHARRCYIASIPLFSIASFFSLGVGLGILDGGIGGGVVAAISFVPMIVCFIPGLILINYSAGKLNRIAKDYNSQYKLSYQPVKLHFGVVGNGIGMKLTF
jgi:hypothetical protein